MGKDPSIRSTPGAPAFFRRLKLVSTRTVVAVVFVVVAFAQRGIAIAAPTHTLSIVDPSSAAIDFYSSIATHVDASMGLWNNYLAGSGDIAIDVIITDLVERADFRSDSTAFVRHNGLFNVFESGMVHEIRTGVDPNGELPDIEIRINTDYVASGLWFDPDPLSRTAPVPQDRVDAMSMFLHELGHALGFNGWGDSYTGALPGDYGSSWDALTATYFGTLSFIGPHAMALYGRPVPITAGNNFHIGNAAGAGSDLVQDLMNGVVYYYGTRYSISDLDVAMLQDMGVPITPVPEPNAGLLLLIGIALVSYAAARRRERPGTV